jgi:hypothetical protein
VRVGERERTTMIEFHAIRDAIKGAVSSEGVRNFVADSTVHRLFHRRPTTFADSRSTFSTLRAAAFVKGCKMPTHVRMDIRMQQPFAG